MTRLGPMPTLSTQKYGARNRGDGSVDYHFLIVDQNIQLFFLKRECNIINKTVTFKMKIRKMIIRNTIGIIPINLQP